MSRRLLTIALLSTSRKPTFALLLLSLACTCVRAQEIQPAFGEGTFLTLGLGIPIHTVRDKLHSPLAYRGRGVTVRLEVERVREDWVSQVRLAFSAASLKAKVRPKRDVNKPASLNDLRFGFGLYRRVSAAAVTAESIQYAGLSVALQANSRSYPLPANNVSGNVFRLSARAGVLDRRGLGDNARWSLTSQLDVPFLTRLSRPSYIGLQPFLHRASAKGRDFWKGMTWEGPGGFLGLEARFAADYLAQPWRSDRLEYAFQLGYTPRPDPKSLLFTAGHLSYAYRARL